VVAAPSTRARRPSISAAIADRKVHVDFVCPECSLVIELDGGQHSEREAYDFARTAWLQSQGYRVLRFWNSEVFENLDGVLESILAALRAKP
jgi:very-short-patch-repair endonuclease